MSTRVYDWDQNPSVDRFSYRCSDSSAHDALEAGRADWVTDGDGRRAIQLLPPLAARDFSSGFLSAWRKIPSGGVKVWQMRKSYLRMLEMAELAQ